MNTIDITTISTLRPDVLWVALNSVKNNLHYLGDFRLILDVAPIGDERVKQSDVVRVAKHIFPNILARTNAVSMQAEAQKWVWWRSESPFIIQWEDDWNLLHPIGLRIILKHFEQRPNLAMVFFDRREKPVGNYSGYQGMFSEVEPGFYLRNTFKNFGGPPAVIRRSYLNAALPFLRDDEALDITCRRPECQEFLNRWEFGVLEDPLGRSGLVEDIGKPWREKRGLRMRKDTPVGVRWERANA